MRTSRRNVASQQDQSAGAEVSGRMARLEAALLNAIGAEPVEDGIVHPAEQILDEAIRSVPASTVEKWLEGLILDTRSPATSAALLRCLGRKRDVGTVQWRGRLVREVLRKPDVELRNAAVQAAESWGDAELATVLREHNEPVRWLRQYIVAVAQELEGQDVSRAQDQPR